jgi:hypothetical protein
VVRSSYYPRIRLARTDEKDTKYFSHGIAGAPNEIKTSHPLTTILAR